jgi:hypothetical protein
VTDTGPNLEDGRAIQVLRALLSAPQAIGQSHEVKRFGCKGLTRLDYPTLQAMLALKVAHGSNIDFFDLDHLESALQRYGLTANYFASRQGQA